MPLVFWPLPARRGEWITDRKQIFCTQICDEVLDMDKIMQTEMLAASVVIGMILRFRIRLRPCYSCSQTSDSVTTEYNFMDCFVYLKPCHVHTNVPLGNNVSEIP
jgi:hypothetical protein